MRIVFLSLLVFTSLEVSLADELPTDFKSSEVNESIESFIQSKKSVRSLTTAKLRTNRQELIDKLKAQQEAITKAGDLEEALKIKSLVGQLEAVQAAAQESVVDEGEKAAGKVSIPHGAVKFGNSRYYVFTEPATWHVARIKCGLMGGHLVSIESEAEHQFIVKLIQPLKEQRQNYLQFCWIDGNDEWEQGKFVYSNGKPLTYSKWAPDHGGGKTNRPYIILFSENGLFYDSYTERRMYVCEWE